MQNTLAWGPGTSPTMNLTFNLVDNNTGNSLVEGSLLSFPAQSQGSFLLNSVLDNISAVWSYNGQWAPNKYIGWIKGWFEAPYFG